MLSTRLAGRLSWAITDRRKIAGCLVPSRSTRKPGLPCYDGWIEKVAT